MTGQPRRARPARPVEPDTGRQAETLHGRLDAIARLHSPGPSGWCPECLLEHPCRTYRLATGDPS